jgi:hypothetical protein
VNWRRADFIYGNGTCSNFVFSTQVQFPVINTAVLENAAYYSLLYGLSGLVSPFSMATEYVKRIIYYPTMPPNPACLSNMYRIYFSTSQPASYLDICLGPFSSSSPTVSLTPQTVSYLTYEYPNGTCAIGSLDSKGLCTTFPTTRFGGSYLGYYGRVIGNPIWNWQWPYTGNTGCTNCPTTPFVDYANYLVNPGMQVPCKSTNYSTGSLSPNQWNSMDGVRVWMELDNMTYINQSLINGWLIVPGFPNSKLDCRIGWPAGTPRGTNFTLNPGYFPSWFTDPWTLQTNPFGVRDWAMGIKGASAIVINYRLPKLPTPRSGVICPYLISGFPQYPDDSRYTLTAQFPQFSSATGRQLLVSNSATSSSSTSTKSFKTTTSEMRLKTNIVPTGRRIASLPEYTWQWNGLAKALRLDSDPTVGVMAQEAQAMHPEAVITGADGFLRVNYGLLSRLS